MFADAGAVAPTVAAIVATLLGVTARVGDVAAVASAVSPGCAVGVFCDVELLRHAPNASPTTNVRPTVAEIIEFRFIDQSVQGVWRTNVKLMQS